MDLVDDAADGGIVFSMEQSGGFWPGLHGADVAVDETSGQVPVDGAV